MIKRLVVTKLQVFVGVQSLPTFGVEEVDARPEGEQHDGEAEGDADKSKNARATVRVVSGDDVTRDGHQHRKGTRAQKIPALRKHDGL